MRNRLAVVSFVGAMVLMVLAASPGRAARDGAIVTSSISSLQLLVFETEQCIYCQLFRRDVRPIYERSAKAASLPLRFIDLGVTEQAGLPLARPIQTLPTVVLVKDGREVDRIAGYTGPESFLHLVNRMLATVQ